MKKYLFLFISLLMTNAVLAVQPNADHSDKTTHNFSITTTNGRGQEYSAERVDPQGQSMQINVQTYHQQSNNNTNVNYANPQPGQMGQNE